MKQRKDVLIRQVVGLVNGGKLVAKGCSRQRRLRLVDSFHNLLTALKEVGTVIVCIHNGFEFLIPGGFSRREQGRNLGFLLNQFHPWFATFVS